MARDQPPGLLRRVLAVVKRGVNGEQQAQQK
jgi:hypothetical protein